MPISFVEVPALSRPPKKRPSLLSTAAPDDSDQEIEDEECSCDASPGSEAGSGCFLHWSVWTINHVEGSCVMSLAMSVWQTAGVGLKVQLKICMSRRRTGCPRRRARVWW